MPPPVAPDRGRLFHAIVLMGASLTGTVVSCGGATDVERDDAGTDSGADGLGNGPDGNAGHDGGNTEDVYVGIRGGGMDAFSTIFPDTGTGDVYSNIDSASTDAHFFPDEGPPDVHDAKDEPECYPCIAPAGDR
jgi:hypothetical protein